MPRTIDEGFRDFLTRLTPTPTESAAAASHRKSIKACLDSNFSVLRFFRTGSFGNGTSISGYSDVDYFARLSVKPSANSGTTLSKVRDALDSRFPSTGVRVSCPAVRVPFGSLAKDSTEVVPADLVSLTTSGVNVYDIANCSGGWMRSSPETHNAWVQAVDKKLNNKVRPLIRFIKAWKYYQSVPISSFYLELRVTKYAENEPSIIYAWDVQSVFSHLHDNNLAMMRDPKGISGYISACSTSTQVEEAKSKVATALSRASKAREAENKGNIKDAFSWWNKLYNYNFPSYNK